MIHFPSFTSQVRTLRYQSIGAGGLAAGSEHSIALTADGGVFTVREQEDLITADDGVSTVREQEDLITADGGVFTLREQEDLILLTKRVGVTP